jgi:prepilin-type processing-associated H-X9-DG protein
MTFGSVTDGLSNTIFASEVVIAGAMDSNSTNNTPVKGGAALNQPVDLRGGVTPMQCFNRVSGSVYTGDGTTGRIGLRWCDAMNVHTMFNTCLPPNSANCMAQATANENALMSASSNHTGGVNVVLCDGSVQFVSQTVNTGNLNAVPPDGDDNPTSKRYMDYRGKTFYGVWGAMGTSFAGDPTPTF